MVKRTNHPRHIWTREEEQYFAERYPIMRTDELAAQLGLKPGQLHDKAVALRIKKDPAWMKAHLQECARRAHRSPGWKGFKPGHATWNKGLKHDAGGRSVQTRLQPKSLPHNYRPIGSERLADGYRERKMTQTGYPPRDWVPVHHLVWADAGRGKIPKGMALTFRDGDKSNFAIENLEIVSRAELMRRNSIHNYGPEIAHIGQLKGALLRQIRRKTTDEK